THTQRAGRVLAAAYVEETAVLVVLHHARLEGHPEHVARDERAFGLVVPAFAHVPRAVRPEAEGEVDQRRIGTGAGVRPEASVETHAGTRGELDVPAGGRHGGRGVTAGIAASITAAGLLERAAGGGGVDGAGPCGRRRRVAHRDVD